MGIFWHDYLYTPLLNFLIFLYSGPAFGNLGVAVIELTVLLRTVLLERGAKDATVFPQHVAVAVSELPNQPSGALDVGEEEGDGPARKLGHASSAPAYVETAAVSSRTVYEAGVLDRAGAF